MTVVTQQVDLEIEYDPHRCNRCGMCLEVCPFNVWELPVDGPAVIARPEDCTNCTACAKNCLGNAINVRNIGCGCIWNESARRSGKVEESVIGKNQDSCSPTEGKSCCE
ncbi:MAG: 4Fe-4S dicluster domain-containing protein [Candidatus Thorarchaeota archaeon]|nr:4Fe-4S dicluster domain-containing protein [Candidatus Thorarchaeota archaeon]